MESTTIEKNGCPYCGKSFYNVSSRNRHIKSQHPDEQHQSNSLLDQQNNFVCPLCVDKIGFKSHCLLVQHLKGIHDINIKESLTTFTHKEDFYQWMVQDKKEVNYTVERKICRPSYSYVYYKCNRSYSHLYQSKSMNKRMAKAGGSIKIQGVCPSRMIVTFFDEKVEVKYCETHVGHDEELRAQRLTKVEQENLARKLKSGVSVSRILKDARKVQNNTLERINLLNRSDLQYLKRKFNIDKRRNMDDIVAVSLKVEEWNANANNYAFLYKKMGFMNRSMERKLKDFKKIICIDGTHCTNTKGFELTVVQVKDNKNAGFPVAFFLSNRQDQLIQEVYFKALKEKIGASIEPEYLMTDDDGKYFNAWIKEMENIPRRLLCTWHVVKNWNIKGKAKIKDPDIKKSMKSDLHQIMTVLREDEFKNLKQTYFEKLESANEMEFLNYLKKYYFQSEERVKMWAHCHRIGSGINTNMGLESFNKFLKYNYLERNKVTVEKLLDVLDEVVDEKMWKAVASIERPTSNNYQDKIIAKAHRKAEENYMQNVEEVEFGKYKVISSTGNKFYLVSYTNVIVCDCQSPVCKICLICIHKYECECVEYMIKNTICKHMHMVSLYERGRMGAVSFAANGNTQETNLCAEEKSTRIIKLEDAITEFVDEKFNNSIEEDTEFITHKKIIMEEIFNAVDLFI